VQNLDTAFNYSTIRKGLLTIMAGVEGMAFINSKNGNLSVEQPDIGLNLVSGSTITGLGGNNTWKAHGLKDFFYDSMYKSILHKDAWSALPVSKMY